MELGINTGFVITDVGNAAASSASPKGPLIHITQFKVSDAVNLTPDGTETALPGNILHTGVVANYYVVAYDTIELILFMDATVGPFLFGSLGIYLEDGTLFALCSYDTLQQKARAVGVQAGTQWRIRARLKFARASVVCQVDVINTSAILEVADWQSLVTPVNQVGNANMAIVHESTPYDSSILVYKTNDDSWAVNDFVTLLVGHTDDAGCVIDTDTVTHSGLASFDFELPQTVSRYLIQFPDGDIRKVVSQSTPDSITFAPAKAVPLTGKFSVLEDAHSAGSRIRWADRVEYNEFLESFNPLWATPSGTYPASNQGINQTALALLNPPARPGRNEWDRLHDAVIAKCKLHNVPYDSLMYLDYTYTYNNAYGFGLKTIRDKFDLLLATISPLTQNKNVSTSAFLESIAPAGGTVTETAQWQGTFTHTITLAYPSSADFQGLVNGGHKIALTASVATGANANWTELKNFLAALGTITIHRGSTTTTGTGTASSTIGLYGLTTAYQQLFAHSVSITGGALTYEVWAKKESEIVTLQVKVVDTAAAGAEADLFTSACTVFRPTSELFNTPVLAYPVVSSAEVVDPTSTPAPTPTPTPSPTPAPTAWAVTPSTVNLSLNQAETATRTIAVVSGGIPDHISYVSGSLGEFGGNIVFNGNNVQVSGTTGGPGSYSITHALYDSLNRSVNLVTNLTILPWTVSPNPVNLSVDALQTVTDLLIATANGGTLSTISYVSGSLGEFSGTISKNGNNVLISGTASATGGSFSITHALTNSYGSVTNLVTNVTVRPWVASPASWSVTVDPGQTTSATVVATLSGGTPSGSPVWLSGDPGIVGSVSYSGQNIVLAGTAVTTPGTYTATYRLTSSRGATTDFTTVVTIRPWTVSPSSWSTTLAAGASIPATTIATVSGGTPSGSPVFVSGDPGMSGSITYSGNNIVVSGTATLTPGTYTATYQLTSTTGATTNLTTTLTVV